MKKNINGRKVFILMLLLFSVNILVFSCKRDLKTTNTGTFILLRNDSKQDTILRGMDFQVRNYYNSENETQRSTIEWKNKKTYSLKNINPKTRYDSLTFTIKIDSIVKDTFYESIYSKQLKLKILRKMIKIRDSW